MVLWHLITLNRAPLPMFDEVFFHAVTQAYLNTGSYTLTILPGLYEHEILFYGPVYFQLQAGLMQLLGSGIWEFRLLNALCGFLILWGVFQQARHWKIPQTMAVFACILLLLDNVFATILHSGRMDFLALFLAFMGILALQHKTGQPGWYLGGSLLLGLVLITTPRILFVLPWFFAVGYQYRKHHKTTLHGLALLLLCGPGLWWVGIRVGGLAYYEMMTHPVIMGHVGSRSGFWDSLFRYGYQVPLVLLWVCSLVCTGYRWKKRKEKIPASLWGIHASILLFLVLVEEKAPYSAMVLPLMVLAVLYFLEKLLTEEHRFSVFSTRVPGQQIGLAVFFVQIGLSAGIFGAKSWGELSLWTERSESHMNIPHHAPHRLYSQPVFYHAIIASGREFRFVGDTTQRQPGEGVELRNQKLQYHSWKDRVSSFTTSYNPVWLYPEDYTDIPVKSE